jgi:hypothetical protein
VDSGVAGSENLSRYVVGIDLGTTNSAVTFVDASAETRRVQTFRVPQLVAPGQVESLETLPSFHYQPAPGELPAGALRLPWGKQEPGYAVGSFARDHGSLVPGRMISSAKSWLCHTGVDRTAELLPWHGAADVDRISPVETSARYLKHIREAWDAHFPQDRLAEQEVVITLPASFDEVARELTVKAAAASGLPRVVLIEEPQAAFYAWIDRHAHDWERLVTPGQKILVCDIGGGTSDFTLIRVRRGEDGKIQFHRIAVGEHLILGGDNLDLALAHHLEQKLAAGGIELEPRQWGLLLAGCRRVKETLLGSAAPERLTLPLPGTGARLIGGGLQVEVTREEVREVLVEGFFPNVALGDTPASRRSGFQEFGLPYAADPAVTRYLAAFLTAHRNLALESSSLTPLPMGEGDRAERDYDPARPDIVLFNGGVFASPVLRQRLLEVLTSWFQPEHTAGPGRKTARNTPSWQPVVLENERLDLAVARGAAYYGLVRRGHGVRIAAGLARTYYIGVENSALRAEQSMALCLVPAGIEPGDDVDLASRTFDLRISEPVEFPLFVSSTRLTDQPGELVPFDREQMTPLPPIRTVLRTSKKAEAGTVTVQLHARLTEIGTLDVWCSEAGGRRSWKLQFDVRSATRTDIAVHDAAAEQQGIVDEATWQACRDVINSTFGPNGKEKPSTLVKRLSEALGLHRNEWPASLLRHFWEALLEVEPGRRKTQEHEARWLNLFGFALRPGYGLAVDDWRVAETWRVLSGKLVHPTPTCRAEWWILWRRIAGGLASGQQQALAGPLLAPIRDLHRQMTTGRGKGGSGYSSNGHEAAEVWRLLGSLELLPVPGKIELGELILDLAAKPKFDALRPALLWALGRIAARQPLSGPLNVVIPAETAARWLERVIAEDFQDNMAPLAVMQAARRTGDRYRDLPEKVREAIADWLTRRDAPAHFLQLVREGGRLDSEEQGLVFGESLPNGLRLL